MLHDKILLQCTHSVFTLSKFRLQFFNQFMEVLDFLVKELVLKFGNLTAHLVFAQVSIHIVHKSTLYSFGHFLLEYPVSIHIVNERLLPILFIVF